MGKAKLKNEKATMISLILISSVVFILSFIFLVVSTKKEELGGTLLCAMLAFISGYAVSVFILRIIRYSRITKIQSLILDESYAKLEDISSKIKVSLKTTHKDVKFLIDNGYLDGYRLYEDKVVNIKLEQQRIDELKKNAYLNYQKNVQAEKTATKEQSKPKKKRITSDKCPNCGASVTFVGGEANCPYCGNDLNEE